MRKNKRLEYIRPRTSFWKLLWYNGIPKEPINEPQPEKNKYYFHSTPFWEFEQMKHDIDTPTQHINQPKYHPKTPASLYLFDKIRDDEQ